MPKMKKTLIKLFAVALGIFISVTTTAQQAEEKPKVADLTKISDKEKTKPTDPGIAKEIAQHKVMTANDQLKPIVPGGEFKPMDTHKTVVPPTDTKQTTEIHRPIIPAVSNTAAKRPEVKEQNAADPNQQKAKPVPREKGTAKKEAKADRTPAPKPEPPKDLTDYMKDAKERRAAGAPRDSR